MGLLSNRVERSEIRAGDHIYTYRAVFAYSHHASSVPRDQQGVLQEYSHVVHQLRLSGPILGSDSASVEPRGGTLKFSGHWILTNLCVTQANILAPALFTTARAGIYVGGSKVVHFTYRQNASSSSDASSDLLDLSIPSSCETFPDCGFKQPNSGVVLTFLDCFLGKGNLYSFEYSVPPAVFMAKVRGGTCSTAAADPSDVVIHRAMYLLQNGFGNYDVFQNNCEDFALYCKTGLLVTDKHGVGRSGQASSAIAALFSSPLKFLIPSPVGVATVTAGVYCMSRYATDIGVRSDVIKVPVEDLAVNLGWMTAHEAVADANEASSMVITR